MEESFFKVKGNPRKYKGKVVVESESESSSSFSILRIGRILSTKHKKSFFKPPKRNGKDINGMSDDQLTTLLERSLDDGDRAIAVPVSSNKVSEVTYPSHNL